ARAVPAPARRAHCARLPGRPRAISGGCRLGRRPFVNRMREPMRRPARQAATAPSRYGRAEQEATMGKLVVTEFISLDGIIEDPGGAEGTEHGGWSFRHPTPDGNQFKSDELGASDVQLLGRVTYEGFAAA